MFGGPSLAQLSLSVKVPLLSPSRSRAADDPYLNLGRALRKLRGQAGLTQEQLAARVGVGATYVSQIENGHRGLRWDTLLRVLHAVGADLHALADAVEEQSDVGRVTAARNENPA